jgi:hypothetical protein
MLMGWVAMYIIECVLLLEVGARSVLARGLTWFRFVLPLERIKFHMDLIKLVMQVMAFINQLLHLLLVVHLPIHGVILISPTPQQMGGDLLTVWRWENRRGGIRLLA